MIKDGVKYIGDGAFHLSPCLTNIVIPSSVEYIGEEAFYLTRTAIEEELGTAGDPNTGESVTAYIK